MAYGYKSPNRDQLYLLPPSIADWLPGDHLVWLVLDVVSMMDLSAFHARHRNDGAGRAAYDPAMMLALLLYAYCVGLRSSRRIARACRGDLAFMVICADVVPEHDAIGRFRADHEEAIEDVFVDVLAMCGRAGLASLGTIAIDGTKIASDAALDQNRSESAIRAEVERILSESATADDAEASQPALQGEVEEALPRPGGRLARLQKALAEIEAERAERKGQEDEKAARLAADAAGGRRPRGRAPADPTAALRHAEAGLVAAKARGEAATTRLSRLEATAARHRAEEALAAAADKAAAAPPAPERQANTTDPESAIMKTASGWVQGFNAQAAVNGHQVVLAPSVTKDHNDANQLVPMMEAVGTNVAAAGIAEAVGVVLADAGYWSEDNATAPGPDRLIATRKDWKQRRAAREMGTTSGPPPDDAGPAEAMEHRLRTEEGAAAYGLRSCTVEPVFGQAKENRGIRRFMRRGLAAAESEWSFICTSSNVLKLFAHSGGHRLDEILAPRA
ncbi:MAG: transposase [Acidimicrobiales bacterium]